MAKADVEADVPSGELLKEGDVLSTLFGVGVGGSTISCSCSPVECLAFAGELTSVPDVEAEADVTEVAAGRGDSSTSSQTESERRDVLGEGRTSSGAAIGEEGVPAMDASLFQNALMSPRLVARR